MTEPIERPATAVRISILAEIGVRDALPDVALGRVSPHDGHDQSPLGENRPVRSAVSGTKRGQRVASLIPVHGAPPPVVDT